MTNSRGTNALVSNDAMDSGVGLEVGLVLMLAKILTFERTLQMIFIGSSSDHSHLSTSLVSTNSGR